MVAGVTGDYAGMSNDKTGENPVRRKPKVSWGRLIRPGLVDPKQRPKGVRDGYQVNIPELTTSVIVQCDGVGYASRVLDVSV